MRNTFLDSSFVSNYLTHPLRASMNQISDFIEEAPTLSCLLDAETEKYLLTNKFETELSGLTPNEFIGLTVEELNMSMLEGSKPALVKNIKALNKKVKTTKAPCFFRDFFLTHEGFIQLRHMVRMPIIGEKNKVVAILNYWEDLTPHYDLFELLKLYQKYYLPKQAIQKFIGYLGIETCFCKMPSRAELKVLLTMCLDVGHKQVGKLLQLNLSTIHCHVGAIKDKLRENINLEALIRKLRHKWIPITAVS